MDRSFRDWEHLVRVGLLTVLGVVVFLVARAILVPDDFGRLGHFRAGAITQASAVAPAFAGRAACAECHTEEAEVHAGSVHAGVGCEACHGPLAQHAADPGETAAVVPAAEPLCRTCHSRLVGRPPGFPQVEPDEHAGGEPCDACHLPHDPAL